MKRISHYKTYNPHNFVYDKIELSLEFPEEKPDSECITELISRIEAMAKIAYPWLFEVKYDAPPLRTYIHDEPAQWATPKSEEQIVSESQEIENCQTIEELQKFRLIKEKTPELKQSFTKTMKRLLQMENPSEKKEANNA